MSQTYVYSMYRANKFFGPERQVLRDISLSFFPGAKIGVLGANGAGKSTLLRIMAGLDEPSTARRRLAPGATVGYLPQEPELDPAKDVRGNVEDGVAEKRGLLDRFDEINARFAEPMSDDEMTDAARGAGRGAGRDRPHRRLGPRPHARHRHGRAAAAAGRRRGGQPLRRRAAPRRAVPRCCCRRPTCCCSTSRPTTSTPSRSPGSSGTWTSTPAPSSPSPTTATSSTTSPAGSSSSTAATASRGRATTRRGSSRSRRGSRSRRSRSRARRRTLAARARVGADGAAGAAGQEQGAPAAPTSSCCAEETARQADTVEIHIPAGAAPRRPGRRGPRTCARATATGC